MPCHRGGEVNMTAHGQLWGIVLAGGDGVRLRPLIHRLYTDGRPKQFASLVGSASLVRQTIDRVRLVIPGNRTLVVIQGRHLRYLDEALDGVAPRVLTQPVDKGTSAGVLLPVHWVSQWDPEGIVAVFPSDHFVDDDRAFMDHIAD